MTDMQGMLFPPLDDEDCQDDEGNTQNRVLPQEIEDRFSKVRSLLREKASAEDDASAAELKRKQEEAALEAARAVQEEVSRLQNGIAELEAMYATQQRQQQQQQQQLHFLQDEGEDEESDSEDDGDDEQVGIPANNNINNHHVDGIVFPALPSIINAVEPESDADTRSNESASQADDRVEPPADAVVATKDILCDA